MFSYYAARLIKVKTIISIALIFLFGLLALTNRIDGQSVKDITLMVVAFYFGTQSGKTGGGGE